ncbi:MAG: Slp family lipoprotein [Candidatus Competibacteraceae bacterium]
MRCNWLIFVLILSLSAGCATVTTSGITGTVNRLTADAEVYSAQHSIPHSIGQTSVNDLSSTPVTVEAVTLYGERVSGWHVTVSLANEPGWTLVEVQAYALDQTGRPRFDTATEGRFLARAWIPFDEVVYAEG